MGLGLGMVRAFLSILESLSRPVFGGTRECTMQGNSCRPWHAMRMYFNMLASLKIRSKSLLLRLADTSAADFRDQAPNNFPNRSPLQTSRVRVFFKPGVASACRRCTCTRSSSKLPLFNQEVACFSLTGAAHRLLKH